MLIKIHQDFPNAQIVLTGHSLGGALTQIVGDAAKLTIVSFDALGS
jgi:putative lipase involved disintegration of autophagic bodies